MAPLHAPCLSGVAERFLFILTIIGTATSSTNRKISTSGGDYAPSHLELLLTDI